MTRTECTVGTGVAASIIGIKPETLKGWIHRHPDLVPSIGAGGTGNRRKFTRSALVQLALAREAIACGVPLHTALDAAWQFSVSPPNGPTLLLISKHGAIVVPAFAVGEGLARLHWTAHVLDASAVFHRVCHRLKALPPPLPA